jgi:hypothetical protein
MENLPVVPERPTGLKPGPARWWATPARCRNFVAAVFPLRPGRESIGRLPLAMDVKTRSLPGEAAGWLPDRVHR